MNKNPYENKKKYASVKGVFLGLLSTLPQDFSYRMRKGQGFAILADFPWLGYTRFICQADREDVYSARIRTYTPIRSKEIELMTPAEAVLQICNLSIAAARGGGRHEIGHAICDLAGYERPSEKEFNKKVKKHIKLTRKEYSRANLHKWVNLLADIRLERWVGKEYPASVPDFFAIQRWVHRLEEQSRGKTFAGDFLMALRDKGKGWRDEAAEKVYQEYSQEARDLVAQLEPIWSQVLKKGTLEDTAHLPLAVGLKLLNEIADLVKEPEPPEDEGQGRSNPEDEGSDSGSSGGSSDKDSDNGDDEEDDEEGSSGSDDEEGEDDEEGSSGSEDGDDEEDEDEDSSGSDDGDDDEEEEGSSGSEDGDEEDDEEGSEASGGDSGDEGGKQGGSEGSLDIEKISSLLDGDGEALNPSSAMDQNIKVVEREFGHKVYVPNEKKIIYRKLELK